MSTEYSFKEASDFGTGFPDKGKKCDKCKVLVPQFESINQAEVDQFRLIAKTKGMDESMGYLMVLSGCSHRFAKIWYLHRDTVLINRE